MTSGEDNKRTEQGGFDGRFSLLSELRDRRVFRAATAYGIVAWGVTEALDGIISGLGWPDWIATLAVIVFVTGFPVAMFLAWIYDWTPGGIRRTGPSRMGWLPAVSAALFLSVATAGLFWLINPSGMARTETVGVAVLPCRYRGGESLAFRARSFAEVLSARLSYSRELFVPDFDAVSRIAASNPTTTELARRLDVDWLVDCRLTEREDSLLVETSLIDAATDESNSLSSSEAASLGITVTFNAIGTALSRELEAVPASDMPTGLDSFMTSSMGAFDEYLAGLDAMREGTADGYQRARRHFQDAQRYGTFPLAHLGEANAILAQLEAGLPQPGADDKSIIQAVRLILEAVGRLDPKPAEFYATRLRLANLADQLGILPSASGTERQKWLEHATTIRPSFAEPYYYYAAYLDSRGDNDGAADFRARAHRLAPE